MVRRKTMWIADLGDGCHGEYPTKQMAQKAETEYNLSADISRLDYTFRKYFKEYFKKNDIYDRYVSLCVDCGKTLITWERICGVHRSERGKSTIHEKSLMFLDGNRCVKCNKKIIKLFDSMTRDFDKKNNTLTVLSIGGWEYTHKHSKEDFLHILKIIENWDLKKDIPGE